MDSATRGVYVMLTRFGLKEQLEKLEKEFGKANEIDEATLKAQIALGKLKPFDQLKTRCVVLYLGNQPQADG